MTTSLSARVSLCSDQSMRAGEDPIGTAPQWAEVTVLELDVPRWDELRRYEAWTSGQRAVFEQLGSKVSTDGARFALLMSAPEIPGQPLRVRHYWRGAGGFTRRDYQSVLPQQEWARGLHDTLLEPERLSSRGGHWQEVPVPMGNDLYVCTHGRVDAACGKRGIPVYHALQAAGVRAWRTGHFGGHRFAATAVDLPSGLLWAHLAPELAVQVARREVHPRELRSHLRGFAGLPPLAQVLDRELLMRYGWRWLNADRTAEISGTRVNLHHRFEGRAGQVSARVEQRDTLQLPTSSHTSELSSIPQYCLEDMQGLT